MHTDVSHKNQPDNSWEDSSDPAFLSCHLCARPCASPPVCRPRELHQPGGAVKGRPGYSYAPISTPHSGLSAVCIFSSEGEREHVLGSRVLSSQTQTGKDGSHLHKVPPWGPCSLALMPSTHLVSLAVTVGRSEQWRPL